MNWHKMTPSERYKVLEEEKKIQFKEKAELDRTETLSLKAGWDRYCLMFLCVGMLIVVVKLHETHLGEDLYEKQTSLMEELWSKKDVVTESGKNIHFSARTDATVGSFVVRILEVLPLCLFRNTTMTVSGKILRIPTTTGSSLATENPWLLQRSRYMKPKQKPKTVKDLTTRLDDDVVVNKTELLSPQCDGVRYKPPR